MIDLCVVNYNTRDKLERFLSVLSGDVDPEVWELWLADNGSTDGPYDLLFEGLKYVSRNENIGYARACNQLASFGEGDIIGLLNADVWLTTEDLRRVQARFDDPRMRDVAVLGPKQRDEHHKITHGGIFGSNVEPKHRGWLQYDPHDQLCTDTLSAVTVSGSAYFIRRKVWEELTNCPLYQQLALVHQYPEPAGAFLPTPHYYEETFCSYHVTAHGYRIIYDGSISIGHTWHASSEKGSTADQMFNVSREMFRSACDIHGILHD